MKRLEGFHVRDAGHKNKPRSEPGGTWVYPLENDVLEEVHLYPILHYVEVWRQMIVAFIVTRPIFLF